MTTTGVIVGCFVPLAGHVALVHVTSHRAPPDHAPGTAFN